MPETRTWLVRAAQVLVTFVAFAVFNTLGEAFVIANGVSILYPAAAISVLGCMMFGGWAALGVLLGTLATPWSANADLEGLLRSGAIGALQGLIPWAVFRMRRELSRDLRDMKSLVAFLLFGTILNSAVCALLGNLFIVRKPAGAGIVWRDLFIWWISDFTAVLLIATPILAFGGTLLDRGTHHRPRTITNALQVVSVVLLLGFAASFAIRTYLLNGLEQDRLERHQQWLHAEEKLNRMHANFLRAAFLRPDDPTAPTKLASMTQANRQYIRDLTPAIATAAPELARELPALATLAPGAVVENGPTIIALRSMIDRANAREWLEYAGTRRKILIVASLVDGMVFLILVFAAVMLLYTISRPFAQLRDALQTMREGEPLDASQIDGRYLEFRTVAERLEETSRELRRREEELRLQTEKAIRASRHKSDFLAKMTHELRTPLNAIIGFSDLMTEQEETITREKRLSFLGNVANSAKHLLKLINDLLDIAKVESGKMKLELAPLDLRMSIANTVASTQSLFVRKRQEVDVVTPERPMMVRADAGRIEQVLLNLLSNANKFSPEGDRITVRGAEEEAMWRIDIADHGIGIATEDQQRIFDEFEQVYTRGAHSTGTGLGLALARRFIEAHGGTIGVESGETGGAVFRVRLPRE